MSKSCVMPWIGIEINNDGRLRPCCAWDDRSVMDADGKPYNVSTHSIQEYHTSQALTDIRTRMQAGEKIPQCNKCHHEEDVGIDSMRLRKNRRFTNPVNDDSKLMSVDIKLSNLCNQKCMICNQTASSMIATENKLLFPDTMKNFNYENFNWYKNESRWDELKEIANTAQHFDFYGGEPWLIKKQWEFIRYLVDNDLAKNISINYATNGSIFEDKWFTDYFSKFKHVVILLSADGIEDTFEYVRFPGKWAAFRDNLEKIKHYHDDGVIDWMSIAYTVSAYSIHNVIDSLEFYKSINIPVWFNLANEDEFSAGLLPDDVKLDIGKHIRDNWQDDFILTDKIDYRFFDSELNRDISKVWKDVFANKTVTRDRHRGVSFGNVLPSARKWLNEE